MTEIQREEVLTARWDEMVLIRDRKHVRKLRAQQLARVDAVEDDAFEDDAIECTSSPRCASSVLTVVVGPSCAAYNSEDGKPDQKDVRLLAKPKEKPLTAEYLKKIALTRDALAKHSSSPRFEKIITGRHC
jgi:hypothetical protein